MNSLSALKGDYLLSFDKSIKNKSFLKSYGCQVYFSKYHAFFLYYQLLLCLHQAEIK